MTLPTGVPLGMGWYVLWLSVNAVLLYVLYLLRASTDLLRAARRESERSLPSLNEYLWRLFNESSTDPFEGPVGCAEDLSKLVERTRRANRPMVRYDRLRRHVGFGNLAGCCGTIAALGCGGLYLAKYPSVGVAALVGVVGFSLLTAWSLWHLANAIAYYFLTVRVKNEED